jgi:hypothetical protein
METLLPAESGRCNFRKLLIALAKKEGIVSVGVLAEAGLLHLVSLTPSAQHWGHLRTKIAQARFQRVWQVRVKTLAIK